MQEAFGREFSNRKPYFDPEFNGLIFLEISASQIVLNFCWKVFKDKIYLKVLISGVRKLIRLIILLEAIFTLLMLNSRRTVLIKTDFTLSYNKNHLERELAENSIFTLDDNNTLSIQFSKINYVKTEPGMK